MSYEKIVHDTLLDNYGVFSFNGTKTGNAYADFLLGLPNTMTQDAPIRKTDNGWYVSLFAQDDWRVHPNVTLNLGLRYDLQFPYTDPQDRKLAYVPGAAVAGVADVARGPAVPRRPGHQPRDRHDRLEQHRAPHRRRVGPVGRRAELGPRRLRDVLRQHHAATNGTRRADNQPFTVRQPFPQVYTLSDPYRNTARRQTRSRSPTRPTSPRYALPAQVFGPDLDFVWPYAYQMNLTLQREFFRDYSLSASYVGALGRNLPASLDENYPVYGPGATTANVNARRPYQPGVIGQARVLQSIFSSDYHGLQLAAEKRGAHFSAKAYYTFSKALEDVDYQGGGLPAVQNSSRPELERARTSNDRTHVLRGLRRLAPRLPEGRRRAHQGAAQRLDALGHPADAERPTAHDHVRGRPELRWHRRRSGRHHRRPRARQWTARGRADRTVVRHDGVRAAGGGADGTAGRNIVDGPGRTTFDLGLFKDIRLGGSRMLQLRAEATNLFNTVNYSNPGTGLNAASHLREDPHRGRHAADPAGGAAVVLEKKRKTRPSRWERLGSNDRDGLERPARIGA